MRYDVLSIIAFLLTMAGLLGCPPGGSSGNNGGNQNTADTTAPIISATVPPNTATDVAVNTIIVARFSEAMDASTINASTFLVLDVIYKPPYTMPRDPVGRVFLSRSQRRDIERLSRREPESVGRQATHWSFRSLAEATIEQGYADAIACTTIRKILYAADLRLALFRFWKTTVWDEEAIARALKILWYYERIESLWQRGEVLLAADEKPNLQVLERAYPKQPMRPGQIERVEFDYERHGTIHLLAGLTLHTGLVRHHYRKGIHDRSTYFAPDHRS